MRLKQPGLPGPPPTAAVLGCASTS